MIVALDVDYSTGSDGTESGRCALVAFASWESAASACELVTTVADVRPYVSGRFVERELPCLIAGLAAFDAAYPELDVEVIVVDSNVRLDGNDRPGLGLHLYQHLNRAVPVVGVAKNAFDGLDAVEVHRGDSTRALYVTAAGMDEPRAGAHVASMHGDFRMPTMLRLVDRLSRGDLGGGAATG